ncbi:MAG: DUF1761 domain-containing protein [Crocinitomicaceae bacterium]|nr:DUF1761 domain-containing protein [Crocinitomicaceae bacterium]
MDFSSINWLAVIVATIASFALGALWYSLFFKNTWNREVGIPEEKMKEANLAKIFGTCLLLTAVMATGMAMLIQGHGKGMIDWYGGAWHGVFIGLCFVAPTIGINYLYQRKSIKLFLVDAGYQVAFLKIMGIILGAWQ